MDTLIDRPVFYRNQLVEEAALDKAAVQVSNYDPEYDDPRNVALAIVRTILESSLPLHHETMDGHPPHIP